MRASSTKTESDAARSASSRGSRQLTDWVLDCLREHGSTVEPLPEGGWRVEVGAALVPVLGRRSLELGPAREAAGIAGREPLAWESDAVQSLLGFVRDQGQTAELWMRGVEPEEGLRIIQARLEVEGVKPRLAALSPKPKAMLAFNFKVRWQGSEGREELRSFRFDPQGGVAGEMPPTDQHDFDAAPARSPAGRAALPVREGFEAARAALEGSLGEKLQQRQRRARADHREEESRLNAYYSQLLKDEKQGSPRRGERRSLERVEQLKREWRQKLEALSGAVEEARYGLVSAAVLWVPWLEVEITVPSRPKIVRKTEVNLSLKRWEGLACDGCGKLHTSFRVEGGRLIGRQG